MEAPCPQTLKINAVIFHHGYSSYRFSQDDIALVQLKPINSRGQCAAFTEQTQPACVPRENIQDGSTCRVTGWGSTDDKSNYEDQYLHSANVTINSRLCSNQRSGYGSDLICASGLNSLTPDGCDGDSGGPLECREDNKDWGRSFVYGVSSHRDTCRTGTPTYTNVANYYQWIEEITGRTESPKFDPKAIHKEDCLTIK